MIDPGGGRGQGTGKPDEIKRLTSGLGRGRRKSAVRQLADALLYRSSGTVRGGDGDVPTYSAQRVGAHPELPRAVGHDHGPGQQAMAADGAPERALGGDLHRVGRDRERVDAEPGQVRRPRRRVGEQPGRVRVQKRDHLA